MKLPGSPQRKAVSKWEIKDSVQREGGERKLWGVYKVAGHTDVALLSGVVASSGGMSRVPVLGGLF